VSVRRPHADHQEQARARSLPDSNISINPARTRCLWLNHALFGVQGCCEAVRGPLSTAHKPDCDPRCRADGGPPPPRNGSSARVPSHHHLPVFGRSFR